jgi:hypothetical protein
MALSLWLISEAPRHEDVGENGGIDQKFLISALDEYEWSDSRRDHFTLGEPAPR